MEHRASATRALVALREAGRERLAVEAREFALVAEFAESYAGAPTEGRVLDGMERLVQWGGDGTPAVAEFCSLEMAAMLRISEGSARRRITGALATKYRFPRLWALAMAGELRSWECLEVAELAERLPCELAAVVDDEVATLAGTMSWTRLLELVRARVMALDPAATEARVAGAWRGVRVEQRGEWGASLSGQLDTADGVFLDAQLARIGSILRQGGVEGTDDALRAKAMGVLASPARALQLVQASLTDELPDLDPECPARGQRGHTCGRISEDPEQLLPRAQLVVHLSDQSVATGEGLARVETIGPLLTGWVKDLLGHTRVSVRPVLHPDGLVAADSYECPDRMREWVTLRNPVEPFPFSKRPSRGCDLDHTREWRPPAAAPAPTYPQTREAWTDVLAGTSVGGGPTPDDEGPAGGGPGRTEPGNLGPLSRLFHRAKTHGGWQLSQPMPGVFLWRSPLGFGYLVTPSQSWLIDDPTGRIIPRARSAPLTAAA